MVQVLNRVLCNFLRDIDLTARGKITKLVKEAIDSGRAQQGESPRALLPLLYIEQHEYGCPEYLCR